MRFSSVEERLGVRRLSARMLVAFLVMGLVVGFVLNGASRVVDSFVAYRESVSNSLILANK